MLYCYITQYTVCIDILLNINIVQNTKLIRYLQRQLKMKIACNFNFNYNCKVNLVKTLQVIYV